MLERILISLLFLLLPLAFAQDVIDVDVGKAGLTFSPETVTAANGSTINFHFFPVVHSVAQSSFNSPCVPSGPDAVFSGFFSPSSGVASTMFTMTLTDTRPIWMYCSSATHCQSGMAMVINPPDTGASIDEYKKAAASVPETKSPPAVIGGRLVPNTKNQSEVPASRNATTPAPPDVSILQRAHGTVMGIAVVLMFPFGALTMRLLQVRGVMWLHMAWQVVSLLLLTAGFGMGVNMAKKLGVIYDHPAKHHTLFGTVLFALFWVQPFFGLAHHFLFIKKHSRTAVSHVHIWYGRALFIMAIVNGGLGLHLAALFGHRTVAGEIAYGVVAGFVGLLYVCGASYGEWRRSAAEKPRANGNVRDRA
ncbi:integral membrane protein [Aspergillus sp. HF37]|nr:integral membrane protein [Aspergillus sp. HF37]